METALFKEIIGVIKAEEERRESLLVDKDPEFAYDQWLFTDAPFVNELYLMLLVSLWHHIERDLFDLAARADDGKEVSRHQHQEKISKLGKGKGSVWDKINNRLKPKSCEGYASLETLRLLANSYKHSQSMEPNNNLIKWLKLETGVPYAPLPESDALREGLAELIGLKKDTGYYEIAERFVKIASDFLTNMKSRTRLSRVKPGRVSCNPETFAR